MSNDNKPGIVSDDLVIQGEATQFGKPFVHGDDILTLRQDLPREFRV